MSTTNEQKIARFALRLKTRRDRLGLTQVDLAEKSKISARSIASWESGLNLPNGALLARLATALGVTESWLLGYDLEAESVRSESVGIGAESNRHAPAGITTEERCRDYFNQLLKKANGHPDRLGWLLMEMKRRLPLNSFEGLD